MAYLELMEGTDKTMADIPLGVTIGESSDLWTSVFARLKDAEASAEDAVAAAS